MVKINRFQTRDYFKNRFHVFSFIFSARALASPNFFRESKSGLVLWTAKLFQQTVPTSAYWNACFEGQATWFSFKDFPELLWRIRNVVASDSKAQAIKSPLRIVLPSRIFLCLSQIFASEYKGGLDIYSFKLLCWSTKVQTQKWGQLETEPNK